MSVHKVTWIDHGREAKCAPNPAFPRGIDADLSSGARRTCLVTLPYPAPRCGLWQVRCSDCGLSVMVTAAGRVDDPRSVTLPCEPFEVALGATGSFPDGKLNEDDEGGVVIGVGHNPDSGMVRVDFGTPTKWVALPPEQALELAKLIASHAIAAMKPKDWPSRRGS